MNQPIDISLDLETWDTEIGGDPRSIGACVFNPFRIPQRRCSFTTSGEEQTKLQFYIACDNPLKQSYAVDKDLSPFQLDCLHSEHRKYNLTRSESTVRFWHEAEEEARSAFVNPVDLKDALEMFTAWLKKLGVNPKDRNSVRIWSHGPSFDPPFLARVYRVLGLEVPWHYSSPRDTRTSFDIAGIMDHGVLMQSFNSGVKHHALHDAQTQAKSIDETIASIRQLPSRTFWGV